MTKTGYLAGAAAGTGVDVGLRGSGRIPEPAPSAYGEPHPGAAVPSLATFGRRPDPMAGSLANPRQRAAGSCW